MESNRSPKFHAWLKFAWPIALILGVLVRWLSDMVPEIIRLCGIRLSAGDRVVCAVCELIGDTLLALGAVLAIVFFKDIAVQIKKRLRF